MCSIKHTSWPRRTLESSSSTMTFNPADVYFLSAELNMLSGLTDSQIQLARNWISL